MAFAPGHARLPRRSGRRRRRRPIARGAVGDHTGRGGGCPRWRPGPDLGARRLPRRHSRVLRGGRSPAGRRRLGSGRCRPRDGPDGLAGGRRDARLDRIGPRSPPADRPAGPPVALGHPAEPVATVRCPVLRRRPARWCRGVVRGRRGRGAHVDPPDRRPGRDGRRPAGDVAAHQLRPSSSSPSRPRSTRSAGVWRPGVWARSAWRRSRPR